MPQLASLHDQWPERPAGDLKARLNPVHGAAPDRILVLDRQNPVEAALVEGVDDPAPVDLESAQHPTVLLPILDEVLADRHLHEDRGARWLGNLWDQRLTGN